MNTLFIVGNGFDVLHRLPTGYRDFREAYKTSLEDYLPYFRSFNNTTRFWKEFEKSLGTFKWEEFYSDIASPPSISQLSSPDPLYGFEDEVFEEVKKLIDAIRGAFNSWIYSIETKEIKRVTKLIKFPKPCKFVSFNYTSTLQKVYGIPNCDVLHIHGRVMEKIIFGHNHTPKQKKTNHESYTPWTDDAKERVLHVLDAFRKPVWDILEDVKPQLKSYGNIQKIIVIGHSINDIDKPYFKFILETYPNAKWENYNHGSEIQKTHRRLIRIGVSEENLSSASSGDLIDAPPTP